MKYLIYTLPLIVTNAITDGESDCPFPYCDKRTSKHLSTIDDTWLIEYQDEIQCKYIQSCISDDKEVCPEKKLSLYGAYGSIKVEGAPRIMFYDFMVAPFASPPIPMMDGLGVFVYA